MANYSYNFKINWYEDHDMYSSFSVDKLSGSYRYVSRYSDMCMGVSPRVEPGHPSSPLVHLFPLFTVPFLQSSYCQIKQSSRPVDSIHAAQRSSLLRIFSVFLSTTVYWLIDTASKTCVCVQATTASCCRWPAYIHWADDITTCQSSSYKAPLTTALAPRSTLSCLRVISRPPTSPSHCPPFTRNLPMIDRSSPMIDSSSRWLTGSWSTSRIYVILTASVVYTEDEVRRLYRESVRVAHRNTLRIPTGEIVNLTERTSLRYF